MTIWPCTGKTTKTLQLSTKQNTKTKDCTTPIKQT